MDFGGHLRQNPCSVGLFILAPRVTFVTQTSCPEQNPVGQERLDLLLSPAPTPALTACLLLSLENSASNADAPSNKFVFGQNMSERVLVSGPHGPGLLGPGRVLELLPLFQVRGSGVAATLSPIKLGCFRLRVRERPNLDQLKARARLPAFHEQHSASCLPTLRHPLSHKPWSSWLRCCWDPQSHLRQGWSAPLNHEAAAQRWGVGALCPPYCRTAQPRHSGALGPSLSPGELGQPGRGSGIVCRLPRLGFFSFPVQCAALWVRCECG